MLVKFRIVISFLTDRMVKVICLGWKLILKIIQKYVYVGGHLSY